MSDSSVTVVCLDAVDVAEVARRAVEFLVKRQVIVSNTDRDDLRQPSEWAAGPAAESVLVQPVPQWGLTGWRGLAANGVDVTTDRLLHAAMANFEPSACPRCNGVLDEEEYGNLLVAWAKTDEPIVTCTSCGAAALLGDWRNEWPSAAGAPAIVFNNWPPIAAPFLQQLRAVLGERTAIVRAHF